MFPVLENMSGTISAAVIVGEISAMFCASSSTKFRQFGRSLFITFLSYDWILRARQSPSLPRKRGVPLAVGTLHLCGSQEYSTGNLSRALGFKWMDFISTGL